MAFFWVGVFQMDIAGRIQIKRCSKRTGKIMPIYKSIVQFSILRVIGTSVENKFL